MIKTLLLLTLLLQSSASAAGWVFWGMDSLIRTPANEKTVASAKAILPQLPLYTDKAGSKENYEIDFIFSAKQGEIDEIMLKLNWHKLSADFKKSFFLTIKDLIAGKNSTHFPPAVKHNLNKKFQDLSYGKIINHQRIEFYVWRLPYRTENYIPLWAAAYAGKTARQRGSEIERQNKKQIEEKQKGKKADIRSTTRNGLETQTTFTKALRKLSTLKIISLRHPKRDKNIILIKKAGPF